MREKFYLVSLGCAKNFVDSEEIAGAFIKDGYVIHNRPEESDLAVVNTCAFLREARLEALKTVSWLVRLKNKPQSRLKCVILTGCLTGYYDEPALMKMVPGLDLVVPFRHASLIPNLLHRNDCSDRNDHNAHVNSLNNSDSLTDGYSQKNRFLLAPPHSVYVKISDGCRNRCSYCLIPKLRGKLRSKPLDDIVAEVKALAKLGAKEVNIIAQDTTSYGIDLYGKYMLIPLLQNISRIKGLKWIRLLYAHPARITDDLLDLVAQEEKICKYLDIPIQHSDRKILHLMGRKTEPEEITDLYHVIRERIPSAVLRTTVMVGYPGEGEREFSNLLAFLERHPFERVGAFQFSPEKMTRAYYQGPRVEGDVAQRRLKEVMTLQKQRSQRFNHKLLGQRLDVIVDSYNQQKSMHYGRTAGQAPDVDGKVYLPGFNGRIGDITQVKIVGAGAYDLLGE